MRRQVRRDDAVWAAIVGTAFVVEALGIAGYGGPLSRVTARTFRCNTPAGRIAFAVGWSALTVWFVPHVWRYNFDRGTEEIVRERRNRGADNASTSCSSVHEISSRKLAP